MATFTRESAADYDQRIGRLVPGYGLMHELAPPVLAATLGDDATILVVGAGTGAELVALASQNSRWRLVAVDPSAAMLEVARDRVVRRGLADRVDFHVTDAAQLALDRPHDAAVAILVAHFLPDNGAKQGFYDGIARNLRPGAPLVAVDLGDAVGALAPAYRAWAHGNGMAEDAVDAMFARFAGNFHPVTEQRQAALLHAAGFGPARPFLQVLAYRGFVAHRLDEVG